ncbi:esterase/lipase family protein [Leifsonia sp. NPDC058248]|uniref:esterase/lipase family protein n=1 Tax=Leifsonia sp. NPDC058248 TaxID=3346402 RepID=UPI0036DC0816
MSGVDDLERPRATGRGPGRALAPLRKAGVALLDYEYAVRHQLRAELDRGEPDALVAVEGDRAPVILLPGIFETWRFLRPLARHVHARGHPVHIVTALERNLMSIADGARIVADYLEARDLRNVTIVAHSKGGLVAKYAMGMPGVSGRVRLIVAVSTPFSGSTLARFVPFPSVRALQPTNETLRRLAVAREANSRIVSVSGWFDPHIPNGSHLNGATNVRLPVGGHFRLLDSEPLFDCVDSWLDRRAL